MRPWPEPARPRAGGPWHLAALPGLLAVSLAATAQPVFRDPPALRPLAAPARPAKAASRPEAAALDLLVEWRVAPDDEGLAPSGAGDRTVSTQAAPPPAGTRSTQTRPAADETLNLPTLRVRNGELARAALGQWLRREQVDWVWTPQGGGLQGGTRFDLAQHTLQVQPRWPGGQAPVDLAWSLRLPQASEADAPPGHWQTEGRLSLPLDTWVRLATLTPAAAGTASLATVGTQRGTASLTPRPRALWVRVSRLP